MADGTEPIVGRTFDVFISYAREDVARLTALIGFLERRGYTYWWDKRLVAGEPWKPQLHEMLKRVRKVVALWSPAASNSAYVSHEMSIAFGDKKLVPLRLDGTPAGTVFKDLQHLKVTDFESEADALVEALGEPSEKPVVAPAPSRLSVGDIRLEGLPSGTRHLFGREDELKTLRDAWAGGDLGNDPANKVNAVVLHAIGGAGKSALLRRFLDEMEAKGFAGARKVYGWSAYSQGSGENRQSASADTFIDAALKFFGHDVKAEPITDPVERGRALARLIQQQRTLLVLDGLEPLQDLPEVNEGRLKDRGLQALVEWLARENPGLLVITSRQALPELAKFSRPAEAGKPADTRVINHELESLSIAAGVDLLKHLGVYGREKELRAAVKEVGGHALSVSLLGTYLSAVCGGDVARRDTLRFHELVEVRGETAHDRQARRATRIMDAYVERFEELPRGETETERMILSLIGLFDRPAEPDALNAVLAAPPIAGLTDGWHALDAQQQALRWHYALQRLRALKLISGEGDGAPHAATGGSPPPRGEGTGVGGSQKSYVRGSTPPLTPPRQGEGHRSASAASGGGLDAHPVVRQHFGRRLKDGTPDAFREANRRLYEHYKALPEKLWGKRLPDTLEEMQPLFAAIAHGCAAGLYKEAFEEIHYIRLYRRDEKYLVYKLGGLSAELGALAHYFDPPWTRPHPTLRPQNQAAAFNFAGFALRALGRLREAVEPNAEAARRAALSENWQNAAAGASNLSQLLLTLGDLAPAVVAAREGVVYASKVSDAGRRIINSATLAHALHMAGNMCAAEALFSEAEQLQKKDEPHHPRLYSIRGYHFCELLLEEGRHTEVAERAADAIAIARSRNNLINIALDTLSLGRAAHQAWWGSPPPGGEGTGTGGLLDRRDSPPPHPSPTRGEGEAARRHLDAAVEGLRKAGTEHMLPHGLLARAAFWGDTGEWDKAQEDLVETYEIVSRGGMRLFLTDYQLERARLLLAQIPGVRPPDEFTLVLERAAAANPEPQAERPKGAFAWLKSKLGNAQPPSTPNRKTSEPSPLPALTNADRVRVREARDEWAKADALIQTTGYHRRDGELAAMRGLLDALER